MTQYKNVIDLWQSWNIQSVSDIDKHLGNFRILFAYHSGKIENDSVTYHDTCEIFENRKVISYTGDPFTIIEQQNQRFCHEVLKDRIAAREPISIDLIREIHRILTSGTYDERRYIDKGERPGEFKKHDYVTGINEVGSAPEDVEADLKELIDEINEVGQNSPLKAGAYLHARFEYIHPFADGNGRVGRTLLNYWLMINNYPPTIIYEEDKKDYYEALRLYDEEEELEPLAEFLERQSIKTWSRALGENSVEKERKGLKNFI